MEGLFKREHIGPILAILLFSSFLVLLVEGREKPGFGSWIWRGVDTEDEYFKYIEEFNYELGYEKGYGQGFKDSYTGGCNQGKSARISWLGEGAP